MFRIIACTRPSGDSLNVKEENTVGNRFRRLLNQGVISFPLHLQFALVSAGKQVQSSVNGQESDFVPWYEQQRSGGLNLELQIAVLFPSVMNGDYKSGMGGIVDDAR